MVIVGARGLAKEVLYVMAQLGTLEDLYFFDNVSVDLPDKLFDRFPILRTVDEAQAVFAKGNSSFILGLGNPMHRFRLKNLLTSAGGTLTSAVSPQSDIGGFGNSISNGCTILPGVVITCGVTIGEGCLINPHCSISHDVKIGNYVELAPGVRLTGHCSIGDYTVLGTNAVILPEVKVGSNVIVGAGAVVTKDVPDNVIVAGVPARELRKRNPLTL